MKSIQEIFDNAIFRIPDYQRGYAWQFEQIDDFWQDLKNLQENKQHFTGTLTFEIATSEQFNKWSGDDWIIAGMNYRPFYIVDGQQRLTTIVILINALIESMNDDDQMLYQSKADLTQKYIYRQNERQSLKSYIFGYEVDNPSYEYLKTKIFQQESTGAFSVHETSYTSNLGFVDKTFKEYFQGLSILHREIIFRKATQQLKFDIKVIENDLDIFVVFETMNNRGKPLTNLEKLKNRLIYLSTLLQDANKEEKIQLRLEINDVWKSCYEFLGKNKSNVLDDDVFLRNHFIIFHFFNKEKDYPNKNLFKDIYTVNKTVSGNLNFQNIQRYINSIQLAVKQWFIINNPELSVQLGLIEKLEALCLIRINRLGMRVFAPLIMACYMKESDVNKKVDLLTTIESFIFLNYNCANRKANLGNPYYFNVANAYYNKKDFESIKWDVNSIINVLNYWTYGNSEPGYFTPTEFISTIRDLFRERMEGFYSWKNSLKYFLFEYENYIQKSESRKVNWDTPNSIEHIYPQELEQNNWKAKFSGYTPKQKRILCGSLGNLVLLMNSKNSELSNKDFDFKKRHPKGDGSFVGYFNGSHSEIEVAQYDDWTAKQVVHRGLKMLDFFMQHWNVEFTEKEKMQILFTDETLIMKLNELIK